MDKLISHVARRGLEASKISGKPAEWEVSGWSVALITATAVIFLALSTMIEYTYGHVVSTLTMVESPNMRTEVLQAIPSQDPDAPLDEKKEVREIEADVLLVKQRPITSKFSSTIKHLRARAGRLSRFRGFSLFYVNQIITGRLAMLFARLNVPSGLNMVLAAVITARLSMGWTHIVISEPSEKYWFQRLPSFKLWTKVAIPTAVLAVSEQIAIGLPMIFFFAMHLHEITPDMLSEMTGCQARMLVLKAFSLVALGLFAAVAIVVPARVTLTRVQASLLSESEEPIVPFDRSFNGKFVPAALGGSGVVSMLEAWKTFDWHSRVRVLKVYAKVMAMQIALTMFAFIVISAEAQLITGMTPSALYAHANEKSQAPSSTEA